MIQICHIFTRSIYCECAHVDITDSSHPKSVVHKKKQQNLIHLVEEEDTRDLEEECFRIYSSVVVVNAWLSPKHSKTHSGGHLCFFLRSSPNCHSNSKQMQFLWNLATWQRSWNCWSWVTCTLWKSSYFFHDWSAWYCKSQVLWARGYTVVFP